MYKREKNIEIAVNMMTPELTRLWSFQIVYVHLSLIGSKDHVNYCHHFASIVGVVRCHYLWNYWWKCKKWFPLYRVAANKEATEPRVLSG